MKIQGTSYRSLWPVNAHTVAIIDQTRLPFEFSVKHLHTLEDAARAIVTMEVRGAPLIGATAAYGLALALADDPSDKSLDAATAQLIATRPTAVNLRWAVEAMGRHLKEVAVDDRSAEARRWAAELCDRDVATNRAIGEQGLALIQRIAAAKEPGEPVNILTHCNAGWLATVDWGTATAPIYMAFDAGIPVHVWVDETRPRNQGMALTAFELGQHGVPHTVIVDNTGGHLMQRGQVDLCLVGTDRTTATGDVANKIGTYLKALAAFDNGVPFYVALPSSTIDWSLSDGGAIPIEERDGREVTHLTGRASDGRLTTVQLAPDGTSALNAAFDVTPARLVTGLVTERGVAEASRVGLAGMFPDLVPGE
ncbi:MAG: S-methyl-5-thioribose-1-phosphate isomerase [Candidatus Competibacterales bacterium]